MVSQSLPWWVLHGRGLLTLLGLDCPRRCLRGLASLHSLLIVMCYLVCSHWLCVMCPSLLLLPAYSNSAVILGLYQYVLSPHIMCVCVMCVSTYMVPRIP